LKVRNFTDERKEFDIEKGRLEDIAERLNASSYGQERLIEKEVQRRVDMSL
jgi:hypothetical protein